MKKLENFKKGVQTLNKEEVNSINGGNTGEIWGWVFIVPTWSWMYVNLTAMGG